MIDWIALAKAKFDQNGVTPTAKIAETPISAVLAVARLSISAKSKRDIGIFDSPLPPTSESGRSEEVAMRGAVQSRYDTPQGLRHYLIHVDDLTPDDAEAVMVGAMPPMAPSEWLAMITQLDTLIREYCEVSRMSATAMGQILAARLKQSLASIPNSVDWFRQEIARLRK